MTITTTYTENLTVPVPVTWLSRDVRACFAAYEG
jgi:hypothetical protein